MDFFAMKRKELQALCKLHGIRANLKNSEMAQRLTSLLNEGEKSMNVVELVEKQLEASEMATDFVQSPKAKKVKFSPNNDTFYFVATDKDSDSDWGGRRKSGGKKKVPGWGDSAMRSRKQKMVAGAAESVSLAGQVMSGVENIEKESNAIVLPNGKIERDDARNEISQVVPSVENEALLLKPLLRRSKRKTTLSSSVAICATVETVVRKDTAKPGRRSNRNACKNVSAETNDHMTATVVEMDGLTKENQEPSLLEESSCVVYESLAGFNKEALGMSRKKRKGPNNKRESATKEQPASFAVSTVRDVGSITYGPECEGQTSNLLDLNGGPETEESIVKFISPRGGVLDDQLADVAAGTIGEMHLDGTVPSDTTPTPLDSSAVKQADGDAQNSFTFGVSYTNVEHEQGVAEQDVDENSDGHVEIMHCKNAMDAGDGKEIFEKCDQHADQSILEGNESLKEQIIVPTMIQGYVDSEKDRNEHLEVKNSNISILKQMFSETAKNQRANEINFGIISSELEKCASAASIDSISKDIKTAERIAYAWKMGEDSSFKDIRGGESLSFPICYDGLTHKNDAADITGPGGMEVSKENTVDDEMVEKKPIIVVDNDSTDSFGMLDDVSHEKVDEGQDTSIYRSEEETHTVHSKETEEVHDLHNIGTSATCSADSTESSMLKPEMGVDFPTDSDLGKCSLHEENKALELEAASPIWNNSETNRVFSHEQTSGLKKSGLEMSKANSKSEYIGDVIECDDTYEENLIASPCKLSSMMVSSNVACVSDVRSFTYQPECEGQTSNLEDLNEGSKTEDSVIVKSISRRGAVLDDQLARDIIAGVSEDQKLIDQIVMVQVDMDSKKPTTAVAEAVGENHLGRTVPSDTALTPLDSSPVDQDGNEFQADCVLAGGINKNIGTKLSPTCVSGVPDETAFSWNKVMLCNRDSTKEVMPADNESVMALDSAQKINIVTQEDVYLGTERNSKFDVSVILDSHNIDGLVAKVKFPEISDVTEDSEEKYENESAYGATTKEVVSTDNGPFEELDIAQTLPPVMEEVLEEKSSNLDESDSPDGQVAGDKFFNDCFVNANKQGEEKSETFDDVQMLPTVVEVHECIEKGSNWDDSVHPDLQNTDGQVSEDKFSSGIIVNASEEIEEKYELKSSNNDRSPITIAKRIMDELERGMMPVALKSNGDAQHSSSCGVSYSSNQYEQGDLNCSEGDKYNLKEKEIVAEDLGNDCLDVNASFQEDEENKEGACKIDKIMDAMHDLSMDKNATSKEHSEELLDIQKELLEGLSGEKVDESLDTGIHGGEEENHILNSKETKEILYLHNNGSLITCSADSTKPSMPKPEVGDNSPVTASNHGRCSVHEENEALEFKAVSPIFNSFGRKRFPRDDQISGFKKSSLEMSKSNLKNEYVEDMRIAKEHIDVTEELHHHEHKVMGEVVELKSTKEMSDQCHIGSALMDTNVCIPSIWDDSEVKPCTDNTCPKHQKCSGGAIASVLNAFPSLEDICGLKVFNKAGSENAKEKVSINACLVGQPTDNLRVSEDLEAHTTIGDVMLIKQKADANSLLSFGYVGPNTVSPEVVESLKKNMAAQIAGFEVSNLRSNEASSSKDSTLDDQSKCNTGNDVLVYGNKDNNVVADKVNAGSIEAITGIKNVSDGVNSVEKTAQRLDGDSLSGKRNSAYFKSFSHISRSRPESDSPLSLQKVSLSCGVFEKLNLSVQEGYDSIGLKPGRVSGLKFENAGKDGSTDTPVSGSRHDQTESNALVNIATPLVNSLGMIWLFGDEVHNSDSEISNATSSTEVVKKGNGGVASPQVGAGELGEHKHQVIEEVVKQKSTQELELDSIKGRALGADLTKSIGVSTLIMKKKQRDIFIPKTPKNIGMSEMKENFNARKSEQVTNITSGKPLHNRRALEDLQNK